MKICYLINSSRVGGAELHAYDLAKGMVGLGHSVWMVLPAGEEMVEKYKEADVQVIVDSPKLDIDPSFIFRTARFLKREQIDIVHTHQLKTTVNGILAARLARVPRRIGHIHDTILQWEIPWHKKLIDVAINTLVCNLFATDVIALTPQVKEWLVQGEKISQDKIRVIPNGVDVEKFKNPTGQKSGFLRQKLGLAKETILVGSVGRLTIEKGQIYLIGAIPNVLSKFSINHDQSSKKIHFVLAGEGNQSGVIEQRIKELEIEDQVTLLGYQLEEDKIKILHDLDIFVFPSVREGFGIAMLEAMAAGVPVAASNLPKALREIATDQEVLFFQPQDPHDLAEKIIQLMASEDLRHNLAAAGFKKAQEFSLEKFWDSYERLYQTSLSKL